MGVPTDQGVDPEGAAMKYLCLVYQEEAKLAAMSAAEMDAHVAACLGWAAEVDRAGHHVLSAGLQTVATAATVRCRRGEPVVTDGPFAETKEFLAGFVLIDAADLNEAIRLASRFPGATIGAVEVRPLLEADAEPAAALDRTIAAAFRRNGAGLEPGAASRVASVPQPPTRYGERTPGNF